MRDSEIWVIPMFELVDENTQEAPEPLITNVKVPTEFPHGIHLWLCYLSCGLWLPIYGGHFLLAYLLRK